SPTASPSWQPTPSGGSAWAATPACGCWSATPYRASSTTSTASTARCWRTVGEPAAPPRERCSLAAREGLEGGPGRLLLAADRLEPGLPAADAPLVPDQEPEHHGGARGLARDRARVLHVHVLLR